MIEIPMNVASSPMITVPTMYADAYKSCPSRSSPTVSNEKAENVVTPPISPVARNSRHSGVRVPLSVSPKTIPMRKQPIIFTINVPKGKAERNFDWTN